MNLPKFKYCDLCECFCINCDHKMLSSCSGGCCEECYALVKGKSLQITDYLNSEEIQVFKKISNLKRLMEDSLNRGESKLNFKKLKAEGRLSKNEERTFKNELK